jgi:DNA processing protein
MDDHERGCWAAVNRVPGVGPVRVRRLLSRFGTLAEAWNAPAAELAGAGVERRVVEALVALRGRTGPAAELERARRAGARVLTWLDEDYPSRLETIPDPPPVLYVRGTLLPQDERAVAVVGTRRPTYYGRGLAGRLCGAFAAAGVCVVSGLARGIDTQAHRGALDAGGRTLAVLGHGPDTVYPPENERLAGRIAGAGALLTEYPPGTGPEAQNFPPRNRIISGLVAGVLVVEAGAQSGALITCRFAADQGRDVFAVPGPVTSPASEGCHRLIQDGAKLVRGAADVLDELFPPHAAAPVEALPESAGPGPRQMPLELDEPAGALLRAILDYGGPAGADDLARALARPVQEVTGALARLELEGRVRHVGGMRYVLTTP